jgi:hypothetical protein
MGRGYSGLHRGIWIASADLHRSARLTGLNVVTIYIASYVNNPLVAPFTLYLGLAVGR